VVLVTHELDTILNVRNDSIFLDGERGAGYRGGAPAELLAHSRERKAVDFLTRGGQHRRPERIA
jgi:hypothetical protein